MKSSPYIEQLLGRYLSIRIRSEMEVRRYLALKRKKISVSDTFVQELIAKYTQLGYIDDEKFIESMTHAVLSKGRGGRYLQAKLAGSGIEKSQISQSISTLPKEVVFESMKKRIEKSKAKIDRFDPKERKMRAYKILAQSGFSSSQITSFLDEWLQKG